MNYKNKYKLTWDTRDLKEYGFNVHQVVDYLENYGCELEQIEGSSILFSTNKSHDGLYQELRRNFKTETFKFYE